MELSKDQKITLTIWIVGIVVVTIIGFVLQ